MKLRKITILSAILACLLLSSCGGRTPEKSADTQTASSTYGLTQEDLQKTGGITTSIISSAALQMEIPLDTPVVLGLSAGLAELKAHDLGPEVIRTLEYGLLDNRYFRYLIYVWAIISILPMCFGVSNEIGVAIDEFNSKFVGPVMGFILVISNALAYGDYASGDLARAEIPGGGLMLSLPVPGLKVALVMLYLLCWLGCYILIRTMFLFFNILMIPVCKLIPTLSFWVEAARITGVVIMVALAIFAPGVYIAFYLLILICAALVFRRALRTIDYFKNIYAKPLWQRLKGYSEGIPLVEEKVPSQVKEQIKGDPKLLLKVYFAKENNWMTVFKKHESAYLVADNGGIRLLPLKRAGKKKEPLPILPQTDTYRFVIRDQMLMISICCVTPDVDLTKKIRKKQIGMHFVLSKAYVRRIDEIAAILGMERSL